MDINQRTIELGRIEKTIVALFEDKNLWNHSAVTVESASDAVNAITRYTFNKDDVQFVLTKLARSRVLRGYKKQGKHLYESANCKI